MVRLTRLLYLSLGAAILVLFICCNRLERQIELEQERIDAQLSIYEHTRTKMLLDHGIIGTAIHSVNELREDLSETLEDFDQYKKHQKATDEDQWEHIRQLELDRNK